MINRDSGKKVIKRLKELNVDNYNVSYRFEKFNMCIYVDIMLTNSHKSMNNSIITTSDCRLLLEKKNLKQEFGIEHIII